MPRCEICNKFQPVKLRRFGSFNICIECLDSMYKKLGKEFQVVEIMAMSDDDKDVFVNKFVGGLEST